MPDDKVMLDLVQRVSRLEANQETHIKQTGERFDEVGGKIDTIGTKVDKITEILARIDGGKAVALKVFSVIGAIALIAVTAWQVWVAYHPPHHP